MRGLRLFSRRSIGSFCAGWRGQCARPWTSTDSGTLDRPRRLASAFFASSPTSGGTDGAGVLPASELLTWMSLAVDCSGLTTNSRRYGRLAPFESYGRLAPFESRFESFSAVFEPTPALVKAGVSVAALAALDSVFRLANSSGENSTRIR